MAERRRGRPPVRHVRQSYLAIEQFFLRYFCVHAGRGEDGPPRTGVLKAGGVLLATFPVSCKS